jgi:hypothetical protein
MPAAWQLLTDVLLTLSIAWPSSLTERLARRGVPAEVRRARAAAPMTRKWVSVDDFSGLVRLDVESDALELGGMVRGVLSVRNTERTIRRITLKLLEHDESLNDTMLVRSFLLYTRSAEMVRGASPTLIDRMPFEFSLAEEARVLPERAEQAWTPHGWHPSMPRWVFDWAGEDAGVNRGDVVCPSVRASDRRRASKSLGPDDVPTPHATGGGERDDVRVSAAAVPTSDARRCDATARSRGGRSQGEIVPQRGAAVHVVTHSPMAGVRHMLRLVLEPCDARSEAVGMCGRDRQGAPRSDAEISRDGGTLS